MTMTIYPVNFGLDVSVRIDVVDGFKVITVLCPLYKSKEFKLKHSYSIEFSDYEILRDRDFTTAMRNHFPS